jgi:hypothetical protein
MYETPELEMVGPASELIQAFLGPHNDFGANSLSLGAISPEFEEDED